MSGDTNKLLSALTSRRQKRDKKKQKRAKKKCPLLQGDVMIAVYKAGTFDPLKKVPVTLTGPTPGTATTDKMGIVEFLDREPGAYNYSVDYSGTPYVDDLKVAESGDFQLSGGSILVKKSYVSPVSAIVATLKDDTGNNVTDMVTFSIMGPISKSLPEAAGPTGRFDSIAVGTYEVSAKASIPPKGETQKYANATVSKSSVKATEGDEVSVDLVIPLVNVVTPQITLDKKNLKVHRPSHDDGAEKDIHHFLSEPDEESKPELVKITLSYSESYPTKAFEGTRTVVANEKITLWLDKECTTQFGSKGGPYPVIPYNELKSGKELWARGEEAGDVQVQLLLDANDKQHVFVDANAEEKLKVEGRWITPRVEVEYLVVLRDLELWKYQKKNDSRDGSAEVEDKDHIKPDAMRIDLSVVDTEGNVNYSGKGKLTLTPANAEVFEDEACSKVFDLSEKIELAKLTGNKPLSLWMRGKTTGKFKVSLEMDSSDDPYVFVAKKAEGEIGCVELKLKLEQYVESDVNLAVNPDVADCDTYWNELKGLDLKQKEMTAEQKVVPGRILHVQQDAAHVRAKLIIEKVNSADWPAQAKDYTLAIATADSDKAGKKRSGDLKAFDKAVEGGEKLLPHSLPLADAKVKETEYWLEGTAACDGWRGLRISVGIDRPVGGPEKKPKTDGDWAALTVIKIKEVLCKLENDGTENYVDGNKVFINLDDEGRDLKTSAGKRKVEISAEIEPKLEKVELYFQVVEKEDVYTIAELPDTFKEKKIQNLKYTLKPQDRPDRKKLLHVKAETDDQGKAKTDKLKTSQLGLAEFKIGAYILQDVEQARYIDGHADLSKRKPVLSTDWKVIWRRVFFKVVAMKRWSGASYSDRFDEAALTAQMEAVGVELEKKGEALAEDYKSVLTNYKGWARAALGGDGGKREMYLCLISGRDKGFEDRNFGLGAPVGKQPTWNLPFVRFRDVTSKASYLKTCKATYDGTDYDLLAGTTLNQTEDFKFSLEIDVTATWDQIKLADNEAKANDFLVNAAITITLNECKSSSGVSWEEAVVVCMDTREPMHATQDAKNSATHTFLHEIGHFLGLAAKYHPDHTDTVNPNFYSEQVGETSARGKGGYGVGPHCDGLTDQCIVWYQFQMTLDYCNACKLHMRAREFNMPAKSKVSGRDKF